jgi:hypothetical protein
MVQYTIFPVPGGTSLQPQDFYVQTYVLIGNANLTPRAPVWAHRIEAYYDISLRTWQRSYNLSLIGKDRLPSGKQVYDLSPKQVPPEQVQLHSWSWSYNLNLIGRDRMLVGGQVSDLAPAQRQPDQIQLRSWQWSYNLNLIGQDRLPVGDISTALPPQPPVPIGLTWIASPAQPAPVTQVTFRGMWKSLPDQPIAPLIQTAFPNLVILQPTVVTFIIRQSDWPLPQAQQQPAQTWTWQYNLNLIGQDKLPVGGKIFDRPTLSIPPAQTWLDLPKYNLIAKPFFQSDWPNPTQPYRLEQTWVRSYNLDLIGQDQLPIRQQSWPLPLVPQQPALTWTDPSKIWLTAPVLNITIGQYWDRPQLPVPPAQSWTASYNQNLIGQDKLPTGKQVIDLPPRDFARLFQTWISSVNLALTAPAVTPTVFRGHYRSLPEQPVSAFQTWTQSTNLALTTAPVQRPFVQSDWPLTPAPRTSAQTWIDQTKIALLAAQKPFAQTEWPNPTPFAREPSLSTIAASFNKNLIGRDRLPNRQQDWPLPIAAPPVPLQIMVAGKPFFLVPPQPLPPGAAFYDRPQLRPGTSADLANPAWRWPQITPPPVTGVIPLRTLMGTGV